MWFYLYLLIPLTLAEVFTFKNSNVSCVLTEDSVYSALYFSDPQLEVRRTLSEVTTWFNDDWEIGTTREEPFDPITDIRWESLEKMTGEVPLNERATSISVCFNSSINFSTFPHTEFIHLSPERHKVSHCEWSHYIIQRTQILEVRGANYRKVWNTSLVPKSLVFSKSAPLKIHNYDFRFSTLTTETLSYLDLSNVSTSDRICISLFVSIDKGCSLDLTLTSASLNRTTIKGFNRANDFKKWKRVEIESGYDGTGRLYFNRTSDKKYGYWAIDGIHMCKPKIDRIDVESRNVFCRTLNETKLGGFCNPPGFLGTNCATTCAEIFGKSNFCENFRICEENGCLCPWGHQGETCTVCERGSYGLNCSSNFDLEKCESYNSVTGCEKCKRSFFGKQCSKKIPVLLKAPILKSIKKDSVEIEFRSDFGKGEAQPEFYQIQFKEVGADRYVNYSIEPFTLGSKTVKIRNLEPNKFGYKIRIVLIVENQFLDGPELVTQKKSLRVVRIGLDSIDLEWSHSNNGKNFTLKYECCATTESVVTSSNRITLKLMGSACSIRLYQDELIDEVLAFSNSTDVESQIISCQIRSSISLKEPTFGYLSYLLASLLILAFVGVTFYFLIKYKKVKQRDSEDTKSLLNEVRYTKDIKIEELEDYLKFSIVKSNRLSEEFKSIPNEKTRSCGVALLEENSNKNRDLNFVPYDFSRVFLKTLEFEGDYVNVTTDTGDYINASYIDGFSRQQMYIACQGPKYGTVNDFWRMLWQERVQIVVMATNCIGNDGNRMCAEYWSQNLNIPSQYGKISVKLTNEKTFTNYSFRTLEVAYKNSTRQIRHFQLHWGNDGHILYPGDLLPVIKQLQNSKTSSPIVVHSGFGVDRAGTVILCDLALQMGQTNSINFYELLKNMREQRPHIVNTEEYYILAHLTVLEYYMERNNPFRKSVEKILESEVGDKLEYLERLCWHDSVLEPFLSHTRKTDLVFVDGYKKRKQFVLYKQPTKKEFSKFWENVRSEKLEHVVSLHTLKDKLWPFTYNTSELTVKINQISTTRINRAYTITRLSLVTSERKTKDVLDEIEVNFTELKEWSPKEVVPKSFENIVNIVEDIKNVVSGAKEPVLIMCHDGVNGGALYTILFYALSKYDKEEEIDVCTPARIIRRLHPQFILNEEQLRFIYSAIKEFLLKFDKYNHIYGDNSEEYLVPISVCPSSGKTSSQNVYC